MNDEIGILGTYHELYDEPGFFHLLVTNVIAQHWSTMAADQQDLAKANFQLKCDMACNGNDIISKQLPHNMYAWVLAGEKGEDDMGLVNMLRQRCANTDPKECTTDGPTTRPGKMHRKRNRDKNLYKDGVRTMEPNVDSSCTNGNKDKRDCPSSMLTDKVVLGMARAAGVERLACDAYYTIRQLGKAYLQSELKAGDDASFT